MKEFQIIQQYFSGIGPKRKDVVLGIGDDCALLQPTENQLVAISCDTLVEGTHFLPDMPAKDLGYKSLAVNLSDLAAMGAEPAWMTLAISLPEIDEQWIAEYSQGLHEVAEYYNIALAGGDTTRGAKSLTITVNGQVPQQKALTRSGAKVGDWIYVTGTLGDSALGLDLLLDKQQAADKRDAEFLVNRHYRPTPRVLAGYSLRGIANSAIDLSDGLYADIQHILKASNVGAKVNLELLPLSDAMRNTVEHNRALEYALTGGEDYELLFTVPESQDGTLITAMKQARVPYRKIGQITSENTLTLLKDNQVFPFEHKGFKHF
ncbi:MAG: thiamine-phosphate kinase [Parashewanella sp.]